MIATDILMSEHRVIERLIAALETAANKVSDGKPIRPGFFIDAADFIKGFADGCHHRKEEGVLFKMMSEHGVPVQGGPIGAMLSDHEQGRIFTRAMRDAAVQLEHGPDTAVAEGFEHVEHEETGAGVHEKYLALAERLEKEIGLA